MSTEDLHTLERELGFSYPASFHERLPALVALCKTTPFATIFPATQLLLSASEVKLAQEKCDTRLLPFMSSKEVPEDIYAFDLRSQGPEYNVVVWALHTTVHLWSGFTEFLVWLRQKCLSVTAPCVYADFNALPGAVRRVGVQQVEMAITGYGTLRSLASQGIRLVEGMPLLLYEPNDIQCEATAHFDELLLDPAGRVGAWVALLDPSNVHESALPEPANVSHPCISCGVDLSAHLRAHGRRYAESCPACRTSVMEPMSPPRRGN